MKSFILSIFALSGILCAQAQTQVTKTLTVLFLGNSYTYYNNLPDLIDNLALSKGDDLVYDQNTPGGHTFNNHFNNVTSMAKINQQNWNYVVLQAQSQEPSFSPAQVNAQTFPYAVKLDSAIKHNNACSQTMFFETWGRKFGDQSNCANYPPICTYTGMQNRLKASYKLFADSAKGLMAPAGEAFRASMIANPNLNLYDTDNSHPSLAGSYLTACVFYEMLFKKPCLNSTYLGGLPQTTAQFLQQIANTTVNDSLWTWNMGRFEPYAPFTHSVMAGNAIQFNALPSAPNQNHKWYFGDGAVSFAANPQHTYASALNYTVSHVVNNSCKRDSSVKVITVLSLGLSSSSDAAQVLPFYPNPVKDFVSLPPLSAQSVIRIYTLSGKLVSELNYQPRLSLLHLDAGVYLMEIAHQEYRTHYKLIKE
ncbi:MAG: PKD domain-containing protein [Sediminibacterium sp.]|nr:PKD domain-containing protein [Sediminibacterium sp.]